MRLSFQTVSMLMLSPRMEMKSMLFWTLLTVRHLFVTVLIMTSLKRTQYKEVKEMALTTFNVMLAIAF